MRRIFSWGKRPTVSSSNKGQSTIEFIMTFSLVFAFFFLFLKICMNFTDGYMIHHATYMASRAYLASDAERESPENRDDVAFKHAQIVFKKYLPESLITGFSSELKQNSPSTAKFTPFVGVYINHSTPFSLGIIGGKEELDLRSESFLGREPSRVEVYFQICQAIKTLTGAGCDKQTTLEDNGA